MGKSASFDYSPVDYLILVAKHAHKGQFNPNTVCFLYTNPGYRYIDDVVSRPSSIYSGNTYIWKHYIYIKTDQRVRKTARVSFRLAHKLF